MFVLNLNNYCKNVESHYAWWSLSSTLACTIQTADTIVAHLQEKKEIITDGRLRERVSLANYQLAQLIIHSVFQKLNASHIHFITDSLFWLVNYLELFTYTVYSGLP